MNFLLDFGLSKLMKVLVNTNKKTCIKKKKSGVMCIVYDATIMEMPFINRFLTYISMAQQFFF